MPKLHGARAIMHAQCRWWLLESGIHWHLDERCSHAWLAFLTGLTGELVRWGSRPLPALSRSCCHCPSAWLWHKLVHLLHLPHASRADF